MRPGGGGGRTRPRQRNLGMPNRGGGQVRRQIGVPGGKLPAQQPDYFGQLNAFQADISGEQPGPLGAGWGGAGGGLGTMGMTKVNSWLNTFTDPTARAKAMNGIGYFNQGNPYTPEVGKGVNRGYRGMANSGEYSAPGIYLHQSSYEPGEGGMPNMDFGGYVGATTVGDGGAAQYSPFDRNARGRLRRRGGTTGGYLR